MIRSCDGSDFEVICQIINDAAQAYKGVIPADCWPDSAAQPYMPAEELREEIDAGVEFLGYQIDGQLVGVMGTQDVQDVTLIRHAYVRTSHQSQGIGSRLLSHLVAQASRPMLIGTWADAIWAIRFYQNRGFQLASPAEKDRLLHKYWTVNQRQIETSVVLGDQKWFERAQG